MACIIRPGFCNCNIRQRFINIVNIEVQNSIIPIFIVVLVFTGEFRNAIVMLIPFKGHISGRMVRHIACCPTGILRFNHGLHIVPDCTVSSDCRRNRRFVLFNINHRAFHIQVIVVFTDATTNLNRKFRFLCISAVIRIAFRDLSRIFNLINGKGVRKGFLGRNQHTVSVNNILCNINRRIGICFLFG